ncbi:MAG: hypothetical protein HQ532_00800 [Candidatus Omnitrophica bacterium]|nr:hypothetical protein [Candidatus Omnitrophota bacterium]
MAVRDFGICCTNCQVYWTCETKWYRGERHEENTCCPTCNYYKKCRSLKKGKLKKKKT